MKYMETNSFNPYYNLAFEEFVLKNCADDDYLLLWQNDNTIVIGLHQNPLEEINMKEANAHNVNIVRRMTGGGAVYHDLGNLNFSFITDWNDGVDTTYKRFLRPVVSAFHEIGINIEMKGRNDLLIGEKKVSGNAQALAKNRILHHGTLLINSNLDVISEMLNVSVDKIQSKGIKSVRSRVTNIQAHTDKELSIDFVKALLIESWSKVSQVEERQMPQVDLSKIEELKKNKYETWEWNFGRAPKFNYKSKKKFNGGTVEVNLGIEDGMICKCIFTGDFLSLKPTVEIECKFIGQKYDLDVVRTIIHELPISMYFGDISKDELTECFFLE